MFEVGLLTIGGRLVLESIFTVDLGDLVKNVVEALINIVHDVKNETSNARRLLRGEEVEVGEVIGVDRAPACS